MILSHKQIEELIFEISGNDGLAVYKLLKGNTDVNEFSVAEKLKLTINQVRNIFYKFQSHNLVFSISRKDRKKGWYIYFFTFNYQGAEAAYLRLKKDKLLKLEQRLEKEKAHQFYVCVNGDMRATTENAMEHGFVCIECGQLLVPEDNSKVVSKIEKEIQQLKVEVADLESQLEKRQEKTKLVEENRIKKEANEAERKKHMERKIKRKAKKKALEKKTLNKKIKKIKHNVLKKKVKKGDKGGKKKKVKRR